MIGPSEVLVRVEACALNHLDIWVRQGGRGPSLSMPHILGNDVCGVVEDVGSEVAGLERGQRVILSAGVSCKKCPACLRGDDSQCREFVIRGFQIPGGYAELTKAHAADVYPVSDLLGPEEWAAVPLTFVTAWRMLVGRGQVKPSDTVLVHAAGSGVGVAAIQIAKLFGATVMATAGSDAKCRKAIEIGADAAVNYNKRSFVEDVKQMTGGRGADLVIDNVGQAVWEDSLQAMAVGGRMVFCGVTTGVSVSLDMGFIYRRQLTIMGSFMGGRHELLAALREMERGRLRPIVDKTFPLRQAAAAHQRMLDRKNFGKIVLIP
ncbi:MAG: zinc-binding dehydrogenase [Candidatus Sumerlaeota bacterium]|nr:zinc-binding dehydrogenase [Candidatus Sumerlaeota bacterium]